MSALAIKTFVSWLWRMIGWPGVVAATVYFYYEGVPVLNRLPIVDQIPIMREFGVGRVELERREAVSTATTELLGAADLAAAKAVIEKIQRDRETAVMLQRQASAEAAELKQKDQEDRDALDAATAADNDGDGAYYTDGDRRRLCSFRKRYC
ncbi:hypothetical protein ACQQ2Q_21500 [Agrobacterium sp. ES01]|uniref:hypothetical protein n=1 Tax=Agrobacterium sp. ES01 TaxID=3420714 RepID=UPI003D0B50C1